MAAVDLYWLRDLHHSALHVYVPEGRFVVEQAPAWSEDSRRDVVAEGAVAAQALGRFRLFRYEIRSWRDGSIPDIAEAVESPRRVTDDAAYAQRLLELVPKVPTPVWGRDELRAGEMWNSNSTISRLLARSSSAAIEPFRRGQMDNPPSACMRSIRATASSTPSGWWC